MPRFLLASLALALVGLGAPRAAVAEDPKPVAAPVAASDEAAAAAIETFREEFKAKGLKGDDRLSQRDWAMGKLAKVQHPLVVAELAKIAKGSDATLRMLAILYLGELRLYPGSAGREVEQSLVRAKKDVALVLSALDSIGELRYLGATDQIRDLIRVDDFTMKKAAIAAAGKTRDARLLPDLLKILGLEAKAGSSDGEVVVTEGYSWEGAEAHVDTGDPGDKDQQEAERQVKEALAANQAAAAASAGANGPNGATGGARGGGGASRNVKELIPHALKAVCRITGKTFSGPKDLADWLHENKAWVADALAKAAADEKSQMEAAK